MVCVQKYQFFVCLSLSVRTKALAGKGWTSSLESLPSMCFKLVLIEADRSFPYTSGQLLETPFK